MWHLKLLKPILFSFFIDNIFFQLKNHFVQICLFNFTPEQIQKQRYKYTVLNFLDYAIVNYIITIYNLSMERWFFKHMFTEFNFHIEFHFVIYKLYYLVFRKNTLRDIWQAVDCDRLMNSGLVAPRPS